MARTGKAGQADMELDVSKVMTGVLALLIAEREERLRSVDPERTPKTEILLSRAGLKAEEIACIMGKKGAAVRKTLQRGRK